MISFNPGDIVLLDFPFSTGDQTRRRPALVLLDTGDADVLVSRVTSQPYQESFDIQITDWRRAGLLLPSTARLHKLATLERGLIVRTLGKLGSPDRKAVTNTLAKLFAGWK